MVIICYLFVTYKELIVDEMFPHLSNLSICCMIHV